MEAWDLQHIVCTANNHRDTDHPLRTRRGLLAPTAIEYAAQAMPCMALVGQAAALRHAGLSGDARGVHLHVLRLDDLPIPAAAMCPMRFASSRAPGRRCAPDPLCLHGQSPGRLLPKGVRRSC